MALACDMRIAARSAKMGETYVRLGLAAANGGAYLLPRLVGSGIAAELAFTGDLIPAERALRLGLLNDVVEDGELDQAVLTLATRIAGWPRKALEATKHLFRQSWETDLLGSMSASYWATSALQYGADFREGVESSLEKRKPIYNRRDRDR
jgi:enoyl-CoA hydratase/carnithine racemase